MKAVAMMTMAALLESISWAAGKPGDQNIVACLDEGGGGLMEVPQARMIAIKVFQSAGVKLDVRRGKSFCEARPDHAIVVSLSVNTPKDLYPGALAYVRPFEGVHVQVFYDRIRTYSRQLRPYLLAYVIVHEITHILERIGRHSDSGIMKAHWTSDEHHLMLMNQFPFADEDIRLIHDGLAAPAPLPATVPLVAAAGL